MVIHLGIQDALGERLFQAVEKAVRIKGRLRIHPSQKLVQDGIRNMRLFASRHGWAPFHPSCPPTHEIPDSLRFPSGPFGPSCANLLPFSLSPPALLAMAKKPTARSETIQARVTPDELASPTAIATAQGTTSEVVRPLAAVLLQQAPAHSRESRQLHRAGPLS